MSTPERETHRFCIHFEKLLKQSSELKDAEFYVWSTVSAFCSVEAWLNDLAHLLCRNRRSSLKANEHATLRMLDNALSADQSFKESINSFTAITNQGYSADWGRGPWDELDLLRKIRNGVVHAKPQVAKIKTEEPATVEQIFEGSVEFDLEFTSKLEQSLIQKFKLAKDPDSFLDLVDSSKIAEWAIKTVGECLKNLSDALPRKTSFEKHVLHSMAFPQMGGVDEHTSVTVNGESRP